MTFRRIFAVILLATVVLEARAGFGVPGGLTDERPPSEEVQQIIDSVKPQVEEWLGPLPMYTLLSYKTQVVAGINYFTKVRIDHDKVVHLRVYHGINVEPELSNIMTHKTPDEAIIFF